MWLLLGFSGPEGDHGPSIAGGHGRKDGWQSCAEAIDARSAPDQSLGESSTNTIPEAQPAKLGCLDYSVSNSPMSQHEHNAMRIAIPLLHEFYDSPSFSFYGPLDATVAERWVREDYGHVMDYVEAAGALEGFRRLLDTYCRKLSAAGALANEFIAGRTDEEDIETDTDLFFPGVRDQIAKRKLERSDELPVLVAMLADRLACRASYLQHQNSLTPPHSRHRPMRWPPCDVERAKAGPSDVAYLLRTRDAPSLLTRYTREPYMLVVNARPGTTLRSLTRSTFHGYHDIEIELGRYQRYLTFSKGMLAIAALPNEQTLLLFRRFLPVIYLLQDEIRVVEYEWNPVAYGRLVLEKARVFDSSWDDCVGSTEVSSDRSITRPRRMLISEIRRMPMRQP
ncbi:hypothetical protein [Paraburkholderia azotifigens]|uniref:Uncharacterized protein n=1 Tax=Paraburkholderia azotifigens TaxID=2057004 RepID=A0A5C6V0D7_9BURK|nr:hypothetical protein [Paraburkholderia azotifigens]TXC79092.1 hypothetical protein FRZ40_32210 [Paraburkholderia azotifigens]